MSAVSIGYFDPHLLTPDPVALTALMRVAFGRQRHMTKPWPMSINAIRWDHMNVGVAYQVIEGHVPIHRTATGLDHDDNRIFHLVLAAENRPTLLTAPFSDHNNALIDGDNDSWNGIGLGAIELRAGMAVHFDVSTTWHGIAALPEPSGASHCELPRAVIIQVAGYAATDIESAVGKASEWIARDTLASNAGGQW